MIRQTLFVLLIGLCYWNIQAQTNLPCNAPILTTSLTNYEYIIQEGTNEIYMKIRGGDGGDAYLSGGTCDRRVRGGAGAVVEARFSVGTAANQLQAGGKLRIYVGQAGESENTGCTPIPVGVYGAGGGASGILYLPPGNLETGRWSVLMIAGAGGGGARGSTISVGLGGNATTDGDNAGSALGGTDSRCPGSFIGGLGNSGWAGGGLNCNPQSSEIGGKINTGDIANPASNLRITIIGSGTTAPEDTGGEKDDQPKGGDGITGGGVSDGGGGGGGGFHGGAGSTNFPGGGGGSFLTPYFLSSNSILTAGADGGGIEGSGEALVSANVVIQAPNVVCKDINLSKDQNGQYTLMPDMIDGGTTANCDQVITLSFPNDASSLNLDCSQLVQEVTLVATSSSSLSSTCTATVTLIDDTPPSISCQDTTLYLEQDGTVELLQSQVLVSATDDCNLASVQLSKTQFDCNIGDNAVILTATDEAGNQTTCTSTVTILDTFPPVYNQDLPDTLYLTCGGGLTLVPSATDNCSGKLGGTTTDPTTFPISGTYTVNWQYEDESGNITTSIQTIIVEPGAIYVDQNALPSSLRTGESWQDAYASLQDALDETLNEPENCGGIAEIWVAQGTYIPTQRVEGLISFGNLARERVFYIGRDSIRLYGGFSGVNGTQETSRDQRNPELYPTILDGNRGDTNVSSDNCYRVLYLDGTTANGSLSSSTIIDGFTIRNGNADFFGANGGAGMYIAGNAGSTTTPTINNCTFENNTATFAGAGMYLAGFNGDCSPTITNCSFTNNNASSRGGAIHFDPSNGRVAPSIQNCIFRQNTAASGGAISAVGLGGQQVGLEPTEQLDAQIINCVFDDNGASHILYGEGLMDKQPSFTNCTFNGATSQAIDINLYGNSNSPIDFQNCIFWNNTSLTNNIAAIAPQFCIIGDDSNSDFTGSNGNINQDPLFVDAANGDLSLQMSSPAIEAGRNIAASGIATDLEGNNRLIGCKVDMGAYEFQNPQITKTIIYVDQNVIGGNNDGSSWANAYVDLQDAINAFSIVCNTEIWVAQGTYLPSKDNPASDDDTSRDVNFYINTDGIKIYGGFSGNGTETMLSERNTSTNTTILSGNINDLNDAIDNTLNIIYLDGKTTPITSNTVIDGFIIEGGRSVTTGGTGMYLDGRFGGVCSPTIANCVFRNNYTLFGASAALFIGGLSGESSPSISQCTFESNIAESGAGGAIYINARNGVASPNINQCTFTNNLANEGSDLFLFAFSDGLLQPSITNCTFSSTQSDSESVQFSVDDANVGASFINCIFDKNGSGAKHLLYIADGDNSFNTTLTNCTFTGASVEAIEVAVPQGKGSLQFFNCIFWNNQQLTINSDDFSIANSTVGDDSNNNFAGSNGNINQDPLFVDPANGDLSLQACSPAIDAGDNIAIDTFSTDLAGNTRIINGTVDIGAYERQDLILPDLLSVSNISATDSLFTGADTVQTSGSVTIAAMDTIIFEATETVILKAGFIATSGSNFTARIGQCGVPASNNIFASEIVEQRSEARAQKVENIENKVFTKENNSLIAYPNPFRGNTTIEFELGSASNVQLSIFDLQGRVVKQVYQGTWLDAGQHQVQIAAQDWQAGIYLMRLQTEQEVMTRQLILQR